MRKLPTLAFVMWGAVIAIVAIAYAPGDRAVAVVPVPNQFHLGCDIYDVAQIDPIQPEADHLHAIAGNRSLADDSTYESLLAIEDTSCTPPFVTSAYWTMATYWGDTRIDPHRIAVYYHAPRPQAAAHIPDGLKMLASNDNGEVYFKCGKDPTTHALKPVYGCTEDFRMGFKFPECWDGQSLEPTSLTDAKGTNCPTGTTRLVSLKMAFHYEHPNPGQPLGSPLNVSTGADQISPWTEAHADAFEANQQPKFNDTVQKCVMEQQPLPICSNI
jgi:hypothetical protein